jgi:CheY-like chemotaxis protein
MSEVLVVENDCVTLGALIDCLQAAGHSAVGARNGKEALDLTAAARHRGRPSLILFDLSTPAVEGWDFWERQRNDPMLARIPIISISATFAAVSGDTRKLLTKPIGMAGLLALVASIANPDLRSGDKGI